MKFIQIPALAVLAFSPLASAQTDVSYESGVLLNATDLLPADLLRGESHRVRDHVATDGFLAHFQIDSDFGTFEAIGVPQAKSRIAEIRAIKKLVETSKGDLFAEGMKRSLTQPVDAVKNIVTHPVESVKQAPATVGHFFTKVGSAIGRAGGKVKDSIENDGPPPSGSEIGQAARDAAGFDKAKLDTARQLGVDPYSDNARLQEEMDKVTWAFFAGGLPLRVGAAVASAGVAVAATNMIGIPEDTYALTQSELALRDGRSLAAMGISDENIKTFQVYGPLSSTRRHRIVLALETLSETKGRDLIIKQVTACETPEQVDFLIAALSILAERQRSGSASYTSLAVLGRLPGAVHSNGELHVPAPVDHVTWTEEVAHFATRDDLGTTPKVLLHTGKLSDTAASKLSAKGWKCLNVAYPLQ
jgi:hypothetical protein